MPSQRPLAWTYSGSLEPVHADGTPNIRAFVPHDFDVVFQPIVDATEGRLFAHEALVRCKRARYTEPSVLFENAARQKACGYLGRVIRDVTFARWDQGPVFINVHPDELSSRWFVMPDDPIALHPFDVYLEITETTAFTHFDLCMNVLREVCERTGAHLVVDDFGVGHSNMERVLDLRPRVVKLDASLVRDIDKSKKQWAFVRHVVQLCRGLGADVVAECVETVEELKAVREAGVQFAQGYLLARPSYPAPAPVWPLTPTRPPPAAVRSGRKRPSSAPRKAGPPKNSRSPRRNGSTR